MLNFILQITAYGMYFHIMGQIFPTFMGGVFSAIGLLFVSSLIRGILKLREQKEEIK